MELLSVSPQKLTFYAPYNGPQRRTLTLLNPTHAVVLFKVKSNAFRHYRLKPNAGKVEPYATIEIRVCLQCFDFHEDQEYRHYLSIQSFIKPDSFNGETPLAVCRNLPREDIYTKCLPIKLETKPLFLSKNCLETTCLRQLILERDKLMRSGCPKCVVASKQKRCRKRKYQRDIKFVAIILVSVFAVLITAYLLRKQIAEKLKSFYQNQMDYLQCIHEENSQDSCMDSSSGSCIDSSSGSCIPSSSGSRMGSSSRLCNTPESFISPGVSSIKCK